MSAEERYVDLRLAAFWAQRDGDDAKAKSKFAEAVKVWETLSRQQRSWAETEIRVQVIAKGMNHINETYGW